MAKQKDLVPVIDSHGKSYPAKRSWVLRQALRDAGEFIGETFRFWTPDEQAERRAASRRAEETPRASGGSRDGRTTHPVVLRDNEPEPSTGGAPFLPYPMPRRSAGHRGLRAEYPVLAQEGAGLR